MKVHQAFLRRKTDCQSIGRINIKPSSKGYANDSDVFCTFGKEDGLQYVSPVVHIPIRPAMLTDYKHPERAFFQKLETFGLWQTNWAEILRGIWAISGQTIHTFLAL